MRSLHPQAFSTPLIKCWKRRRWCDPITHCMRINNSICSQFTGEQVVEVSMTAGLLSFFTFLLGLLLGNRLAISRDKRKEFNDAVMPVRAAGLSRHSINQRLMIDGLPSQSLIASFTISFLGGVHNSEENLLSIKVFISRCKCRMHLVLWSIVMTSSFGRS